MSEQIVPRPKASQQLAALVGMDSAAMLDVIKAQCFKTNPANVTDAQLAAFVSIAAELKLNPLLPGFLYAYPVTGGGIVPIVGPDGIYKLMSEHSDIDSWEVEIFPTDVTLAPTHAVAKIWRKGREKPLSYTALLSEWKISTNPNWNSRPRHMLSLRALKHAARQLIHGIPGDEDDRAIMGEINVTPGAETQPETTVTRKDPPKRSGKGVAGVKENDGAIVVESTPVKTETKVEEKKTDAPPEKPADKPADKPAEKPVEKVAEKTADPVNKATTGPLTALTENQTVNVTCKVTKVFALNINLIDVQTPSVQAYVEGEFAGTVYHFGGASRVNGELVPNPEWKVDATVNLELFGRLNKKVNKVMVVVNKITTGGAAEASVDVG